MEYTLSIILSFKQFFHQLTFFIATFKQAPVFKKTINKHPQQYMLKKALNYVFPRNLPTSNYVTCVYCLRFRSSHTKQIINLPNDIVQGSKGGSTSLTQGIPPVCYPRKLHNESTVRILFLKGLCPDNCRCIMVRPLIF